MKSSTKRHGESASKPLKEKHENVLLAKEFFRAVNGRDINKARDFFHSDAVVEMVEGTKMDGVVFLGVLEDLFKSFPDFHIKRVPAELQRDGSVVFRGLVASGTHTGEPYGFGPYEAIPPEGKKFVNDEEELQLFFRDGKISRYVFLTVGKLSGPPGVYTQLGGFPLM